MDQLANTFIDYQMILFMILAPKQCEEEPTPEYEHAGTDRT